MGATTDAAFSHDAKASVGCMRRGLACVLRGVFEQRVLVLRAAGRGRQRARCPPDAAASRCVSMSHRMGAHVHGAPCVHP